MENAPQDRLTRRKGDRVCVIGETVNQRSRAVGHGVDYFATGDHRAQGSVSAGQSLGGNQDVGRNAPVVDRKVATGAADAGHNFIGDSEHAMVSANLRDRLQVSVWRDCCTQRGSADRLKNECCDFFGARGR